MKWKKRQREIKRLRAAHAGKKWQAPFPNLKEGLRPLPPLSNILDLYGAQIKPPQPAPKGLIVDHLHKSSLQVLLSSELPWAGGKKP